MFNNDSPKASPMQSWRNWYDQRQEYVFNLIKRIHVLIDALSLAVENMQADNDFYSRGSRENFDLEKSKTAEFKSQAGTLSAHLSELDAVSFRDIEQSLEILRTQYEEEISSPVEELKLFGFPDVCEHSSSFSNACQSAHEAMARVLKKISYILTYTASSHKQMFAGEVLMRFGKLQKISDDLALMGKSFDELEYKDQRLYRLNAMLASLQLTDSQESIVNGQNQLRVIAACLARDTLIDDTSRQSIGQQIHLKVSQSTCLSYITKCEFYSLLMLMLSSELDDTVRDSVHATIRAKLRGGDMPDAQKLDYYICFLEMLDIQSDDIELKKNILMHMLGEICHDIDRLKQSCLDAGESPVITHKTLVLNSDRLVSDLRRRKTNAKSDPAVLFKPMPGNPDHASGSCEHRLSPIAEEVQINSALSHVSTNYYQQFILLEQMFKFRLESYVCADGSAQDHAEFLNKQIDCLESTKLPSVDYALHLAFWKLKVHTLANLIAAQSRFSMSRPCAYLFFVSPAQWFSPLDIETCKKRFTEAIWSEPSINVEEIIKIYRILESYKDDALVQDMSGMFQDMMDQFWSDDCLDSDSIHRAFKDTSRGLNNVVPHVVDAECKPLIRGL